MVDFANNDIFSLNNDIKKYIKLYANYYKSIVCFAVKR